MAQAGIRAIGLGCVGFASKCGRKDTGKQKGKDDALDLVRNAVIGHRKPLASTSIPFPVTGLYPWVAKRRLQFPRWNHPAVLLVGTEALHDSC